MKLYKIDNEGIAFPKEFWIEDVPDYLKEDFPGKSNEEIFDIMLKNGLYIEVCKNEN